MDICVGCAACALRQNGHSWTCRRPPTIEGHYSNVGWLSSGMRLEYKGFYGDFISEYNKTSSVALFGVPFVQLPVFLPFCRFSEGSDPGFSKPFPLEFPPA
jgi:hypothetical protein